MSRLIDKIDRLLVGKRKYSIALLIVTVTVWFRLANLINGDNVAHIFVGVGAAFMAGNLGEWIVKTIQENQKK